MQAREAANGEKTAVQNGTIVEHIILSNSKQLCKTGAVMEKWKVCEEKLVVTKINPETALPDENKDSEVNCCSNKYCWWIPPQDSIGVAFCSETSVHGFRYIGQKKRHMTERVFWLIAFVCSFATASYLIYRVWERNQRIPVIVSFQPKELHVGSIPFPAVTLCNMNKFPKRKVEELERIAWNPHHPKYSEAKQQLKFVRSVCNAQHSFARDFHFAYKRGAMSQNSENDTIAEESQEEMMDFLQENTLPCGDFIRLCKFGEQHQNCSEIFKPIITDYGKCCTFNILPLPLLLKNPQNEGKPNASLFDNPALGTHRYWNETELQSWQKWDYEDGFVLSEELSHPYKQKRAGMPYGMSVLVDPHLEDYHCPVSDSLGFRFLLHSPLELPHVTEFSSVADLDKEILIEVHPDVTNADEDIKEFDREQRKCYFGKEKQLRFFGPYTGGNCLDECTSAVLTVWCNCTYFYMPRDNQVRICNNELGSADHKCIEKARINLQATLKDNCGHCNTLCEDIAYNYETTIVQLQNAPSLWGDPDTKHHENGAPKWANNKMSIVHVFFGTETTVPKLRTRLYAFADLIANTGGILGLCLGFSILSGVEVIYFLTLRSFWKYCRRRMIGRQIATKFRKMFKPKSDRVIHIDPNKVLVYPSYHHEVKEVKLF